MSADDIILREIVGLMDSSTALVYSVGSQLEREAIIQGLTLATLDTRLRQLVPTYINAVDPSTSTPMPAPSRTPICSGPPPMPAETINCVGTRWVLTNPRPIPGTIVRVRDEVELIGSVDLSSLQLVDFVFGSLSNRPSFLGDTDIVLPSQIKLTIAIPLDSETPLRVVIVSAPSLSDPPSNRKKRQQLTSPPQLFVDDQPAQDQNQQEDCEEVDAQSDSSTTQFAVLLTIDDSACTVEDGGGSKNNNLIVPIVVGSVGGALLLCCCVAVVLVIIIAVVLLPRSHLLLSSRSGDDSDNDQIIDSRSSRATTSPSHSRRHGGTDNSNF